MLSFIDYFFAVRTDIEPLSVSTQVSTQEPTLSDYYQHVLDQLVLDDYDVTMDSDHIRSDHIRVYPKQSEADPTVYNPNILFEDPSYFFFRITIKPSAITREYTLKVSVFSIESTNISDSLIYVFHPWISKEPNHTQTLSFDAGVGSINVPDIRDYIQNTGWNIHAKIRKAVPTLNIPQHSCANCQAVVQSTYGWKQKYVKSTPLK